jgi:hypothetical protein
MAKGQVVGPPKLASKKAVSPFYFASHKAGAQKRTLLLNEYLKKHCS